MEYYQPAGTDSTILQEGLAGPLCVYRKKQSTAALDEDEMDGPVVGPVQFLNPRVANVCFLSFDF